MIRSLYARVVLMYMGTVILSLLIASTITGYFFNQKMTEQSHQDLTKLAQDIVTIQRKTQASSIKSVVSELDTLKNYYIRVYDEQDLVEEYVIQNPSKDDDMLPIPPEIYQKLIGGEMNNWYREAGGNMSVGISFQMNDKTYALFLQPRAENLLLSQVLLMVLSITLIAGGLIFLVSAMYIVKPIRRLTDATQRMAKGDFQVQLNIKRKDELGTLASSFDHMARELEHIEQMRQDFISDVSHEIQSPLTSISGFAKALKSNMVPDEDRNRYLDIISMESERLSKLSDNLLHLASLESEHHPFQPVKYRLDEQIRQVAVACEPQYSAKHIHVELSLPPTQIIADRDQLSQVWHNLLSNSIKFTPDEGEIQIEIVHESHQIKVSVADTGIGMSSEDQERIFERFYKADRSRNRAQSGSGLGLAIVKRIVSIHHGDIQANSSIGQGTRITVILPFTSENNRAGTSNK